MAEHNLTSQEHLILVVDDNRYNLQLLSMVLKNNGYQSMSVSSGPEALQAVEILKPDLILLDLMMPDMDGLEVCRHLKAMPDCREIPIIFLTASREESNLQTAFELGAVDYVTKPFKAAELTARINVHLELRQMRDLAQAAVEAKSQFLANMSHEIRTPLNAMLGMTEFLLTTALTSEQENCLQVIRNSGDILLTLVNDILDFSKLEAQKLTLDLHQFDLRQLVAEIIQLFEREATDKDIELTWEIEPNLPQFLVGDSFRLRQIILNLVTNALKFTQVGQVNLRITSPIIVNTEDTEVLLSVPLRFEVQDTGIGIAPADCHRLFQSFSQVDASTTRAYGGTGLGLAICQQLVQLMGGKIGVESQLGQGSLFWFEIELDTPCPISIPELNGKRLLLIDKDNRESQLMVQQTEGWGMQVTRVSTLERASTEISRGVLEEDAYDLVLFNLMRFRRASDLENVQQICQELRHTQTKTIGIDQWQHNQGDKLQPELTFHCHLLYPAHTSQLLASLVDVLKADQAKFDADQFKTLLEDVRVLVVDDSSVNQQVLERQLQRLGGIADYANNGQEALEHLNQRQYDLVLMDCQMPILDGYETTRLIRLSPVEQPIIIGLTANAHHDDHRQCLAMGMDDYLKKPITFENLAQLLARWLLGDFEGSVSTPAVVDNPEELIDSQALNNLTDGDSGLEQQLLSLYVKEMSAYLEQIQQGITQEDAMMVTRCAHQVKGSSANIGVRLAAQLATTLENNSRKGNFQAAQDILLQLNQVIQRVKAQFTHTDTVDEDCQP